jgi:hypothetical protein
MTDLRLDAALLRDLEGFALGVASEAALADRRPRRGGRVLDDQVERRPMS